MVSVLERSLGDKKPSRRTTAQVIAAISIGGMVVARTMVYRAHADELRESCRAVDLQLGGCEEGANSNGAKGKRSRKNPRSEVAFVKSASS